MLELLIALGLVVQIHFVSASTTIPEATTTPSTIPEMVSWSANKYGVDPEIITKVIQCESTSNPTAIGDHGHSYGISQIYLPAHPEITKDQALDPAWAIDYLAQQISIGKGNRWTCYRKLSTS